MRPPQARPGGLRHLASSTAAGYGTQVATIVAGIASLPIGIEAYGAARFGVWITAVSLTQYATGGALGMPLAVVTAISRHPDPEDAARIAAQGMRLVSAGALALGVLGTVLWAVFPGWARGLFGSEGGVPEVIVAVAVLLAGTLLVQPLNISASVLSGRHRIVARNVYEAVSVLGRLAALVVAAIADLGLAALAVLVVGSDLLVAGVRLVHVITQERVPIGRYLMRPGTGEPGLVRSGLRFLVLQIEVTVIRNTDNLVIAGVLGTAAVTVYAAPFRLVSAASGVINAVQGPLWPAYGAAYGRGDWEWIRRAHEGVVALGLAAGGAIWIGILLFGPPVIRIWLGPEFPVDLDVIMALGAYAFVSTWVNANAILLNALDATQSQVISGGAEAGVNLGSSILLAPVIGLAGVAGGTLLGALSVSAWFLPLDVRRRTEGRLLPGFGRFGIAALYTVLVAVVTHAWARRGVGVPGWWLGAIGLIVLQVGCSAWQFRDQWSPVIRSWRSAS